MLLLPGAMRTRRRAMRRFAAFCARVRARPRGFWVGLLMSTCGQRVRGAIHNAWIVGTARKGLPQKAEGERGVAQQHVFPRLVFFLAALTARLLSRILGALEAPGGASGPNRGGRQAAATPSGVRPWPRSVARKTTQRT